MTSARDLLLSGVGEEELARHVKSLARRGGWCGAHVRYSQGVVEGVHSLRQDGHSCAFGVPDWEFVNEQPGLPLLRIELKGATAKKPEDDPRLEDQRRWGRMIDAANGVVYACWNPQDEDEIRAVLLGPGH
jgi:hypothetical protein